MLNLITIFISQLLLLFLFSFQGFILVFSVCCERSFKLVDDLKKEIDRVRGKDVSFLKAGNIKIITF